MKDCDDCKGRGAVIVIIDGKKTPAVCGVCGGSGRVNE